MPPHLVELEALDVPDLVDHRDQGCGDQPPRQPCRQQPGRTIRTASPISRCRIVVWIGPRNSASGMTVTSVQPGKAIGVSTAIGLAVPDDLTAGRLRLLVAFVGAAGLPDRAHRDRQQRLIRFSGMTSSASGSGAAIDAAVAVEDEGAGRFADRELRQKIRHPREFDDDGKHAGASLVDIDRRRKRRGRRSPVGWAVSVDQCSSLADASRNHSCSVTRYSCPRRGCS